jgi:hypothetical protein
MLPMPSRTLFFSARAIELRSQIEAAIIARNDALFRSLAHEHREVIWANRPEYLAMAHQLADET